MTVKISAFFAGLALSALIAWPAHAEVPTAADFAACNMKAAEEAASDMASTSPRTDQAPRAGQLPPDARPKPPSAGVPRNDVEMPASPAGKAGANPVPRNPTGNTLSSDKDPQINGMAADRGNDRTYVAAYRSCMRQRGF